MKAIVVSRSTTGVRCTIVDETMEGAMDALCFCICAAAGLMPPHPNLSGWYVLQPPSIFTHTRERDIFDHPRPEPWFWDARLQIWRRLPDDREAETAQEMECGGWALLPPLLLALVSWITDPLF
jgi:hypothetical protein